MTSKKYHILSLDGGGSWALIQVMALIDIYGPEAAGHSVLGNFDLVAANSGGSIVVAGLVENLTLTQILAMFCDEPTRRQIFSELPWYEGLSLSRLLAQWPKFSAKRKKLGLSQVLPRTGTTRLNCLQVAGRNGHDVKFIFAAYDYDRDRAKFFRSWNTKVGAVTHTPLYVTLVDAVHASSNAPIAYFDAPAQVDGGQYWDGAMTGYNNPVLAATMEALAEGMSRHDIGVLSIGTGNTMLAQSGPSASPVLMQPSQKSSFLGDARKALLTILADPPDAHTLLAHMALEGLLPTPQQCPSAATSVIRMNPLIQPDGNETDGWKFPQGFDADMFERLVKLDMAAVADSDVSLIRYFSTRWIQGAVRNQSIRVNRGLECEIGHPTYAAAKAAWAVL
jgi:uncharacterized protein